VIGYFTPHQLARDFWTYTCVSLSITHESYGYRESVMTTRSLITVY